MIKVHVSLDDSGETLVRLNPKKIMYYYKSKLTNMTLVQLTNGSMLSVYESETELDDKISRFNNNNSLLVE